MKATLAASLLVAMLASTPAPAQLATTVNDSSTTPAPPPGKRNVYPANDGIKVLRFTTGMVMSAEAIDTVKQVLQLRKE
jgi:hypothetical protein